MRSGPGLTSPEVVMNEKTSAQAESDYETKNRIIKECLSSDKKRVDLNLTMAATIAREVYDLSLARVLLVPHLIDQGKSPVFDGDSGPVVVVNLVQEEKRVLECRAFRDSLREEERVTTVRDIDFVPMRGRVRPASFTLSNVCTLRWPDLNGNAYSMVERSRQRLLRSLATDETTVAIRALSWVCRRFGKSFWVRDSRLAQPAIRAAALRVGLDRNPVILSSPMALAGALSGKFFKPLASGFEKPTAPIATFKVEDDRSIPVYVDGSVPPNSIFVVPSGESLGQLPIFIEPQVLDYDKPERLIKGWLCYQDQGMVFVNVRLTNTVYFGWKGLIDMVKNVLTRGIA